MAQIEKYNIRQAVAIIGHCERTGRTHSNQSIDPERTKDNYSLWPAGNPDQVILDTGTLGQSSARYAYQRLKQRLSEVSCLQRDDVNVLCDWCIHLGVDVPPGYNSQRSFFEACVRHICRLYGEENVMYAWVHMDEETPHIHIGFVPVTRKPLKLRKNASAATKKAYEEAVASGNTTIDRVDADSVITRKHLENWHPAFRTSMINQLGYDPGVHTGITNFLGGNVSVPQLKKKSPNWRKNRNAQAAAFHAMRREAQTGKKAGLDQKITVADPNRQRAQAAPVQNKESKGPSLNDIIKGADDRSGGRRSW